MTQSAVEHWLPDALKAMEKDFPGCHPLSPLERLLLAVLADGADVEVAERVIEHMRQVFVDWNEVRVARITEVARVMSPLPDAEAKARRLRDMLRRLFDLQGSMDLAFLSQVKPSEARRLVAGLDDNLRRDTIAVILFELCPGATLSISPEALAVARKRGILPRAGTKLQLQKELVAAMDQEAAARLVQYLEYAVRTAGKGGGASRKRKAAGGAGAAKRGAGKSAAKAKATKKKTGATVKKTVAKQAGKTAGSRKKQPARKRGK